MADQATLNVNDVFAGVVGVGKEGAPVTAGSPTNEAIAAEKAVADLVSATRKKQEKQHAAQQKIDSEGMLEARRVIAANSLGTADNLEIIDIEALATQKPEKLITGADNTAEVAAFSQETQALYRVKAEGEATAIEQTQKQAQAEVSKIGINETGINEAGINQIVVNGIKQTVDAEKVIQENLGKNPERALTWRAWLSNKLRKMWQIFAKKEKEKHD